MPLESLGQPFNPDEPGRKLREVQVEQESEKELVAREHFEKLREQFYTEKDGWNEYRKGRLVSSDSFANDVLATGCEIALGGKLDRSMQMHIEVSAQFHLSRSSKRLDDASYALAVQAMYDPETARKNLVTAKKYVANIAKSDARTDLSDYITYAGVLLNDKELIERAQSNKETSKGSLHAEMDKILWQTELDPQAAKRQWDALKKKNEYYDAQTDTWLGSRIQKEDQVSYTQLQLLAVLIEARLEAKGVMKTPLETPLQIPEERNF